MKRALRIGLAGLGSVGGEVARLLLNEQAALSAQAGGLLMLSAVSARTRDKKRAADVSALPWESNPVALAVREDVDLFVELLGGADGPALDSVVAALEAGKPVVTGNKAMLAKHWGRLFELSRKHRAPLMFEASVAGGVPVIKVLGEALAGNRIGRISGILNGTCNYILSAMEARSIPFEAALGEAQAMGYAEADPTLDIDGWDSAHKLVILAKMSMDAGATPEQVEVAGIRNIALGDVMAAQAMGKVIRLVAQVENGPEDTIRMSVAPTLLDHTHPLAHVGGAMNAITIEALPVQTCTLIGPGAGAGPTASAVLADIIDIARRL